MKIELGVAPVANSRSSPRHFEINLRRALRASGKFAIARACILEWELGRDEDDYLKGPFQCGKQAMGQITFPVVNRHQALESVHFLISFLKKSVSFEPGAKTECLLMQSSKLSFTEKCQY